MPRLIIDDMPVEVPAGTRVIEAAEQLDIMIPRFCYLKVLGAVGACRMCAVHFVDGPVKGIDMSCMVEAQDGMVVSTTDSEAVSFRRQVIEWLMMNHPHDCPVCDEGGQCLLQDETVSGGHGIRRYPGRKRTYRDQYLGFFIQHEMNRCIHCYRCSRFYREYAGYRDFGVLQIGSRVFFGRYEEGALQSPFAGNLVDICPTGVFTDKPARYKARRWDMQRAPSVCVHCSLGCNTTANGYHQEIIRQEARENNRVNGSFICDRGRFGCFHANHPERPWRPAVGRAEADWKTTLTTAAEKLHDVIGKYGSEAVAVIGSPRAGLETLCMLAQSCSRLGFQGPLLFTDPGLERRVRSAIRNLDQRLAVSLSEIEEADSILVIGADPIHEAPMLALAMRQAARHGASVAVVDPRPVSLPFDFSLLSADTEKMPYISGLLVHRALDRQAVADLGDRALDFYDSLAPRVVFENSDDYTLQDIAARFAECERPVVVCGTSIVPDTLPDFAADLARLLDGTKNRCGLFYILPGPNAFAAALLGKTGELTFPEMLMSMEKGGIRAIIAVEANPFHDFPDRDLLEKALAKADLLICLDHLPSRFAAGAHILCPTTTHYEAGEDFVNNEGHLQHSSAVHPCARPLSLITGGGHPRRKFDRDGESRNPRPAWQILEQLTCMMTGEEYEPDNIFFPASGKNHTFVEDQLSRLDLTSGKERLLGKRTVEGYVPLPQPPAKEGKENGRMKLVLTQWTYGTEELSSYSGPILSAGKKPVALLHDRDAAEAGLCDGDFVTVRLDHGEVRLPMETSAQMARGCVVLPMHGEILWQQLAYPRSGSMLCRVEKAEK